MPFIDLSLPERKRFLQSFTGCHIPGYTGHCPTLKFHYGRGFGSATREILQMLKNRPQSYVTKSKQQPDRELKPVTEPVAAKDDRIDVNDYINLPKRAYILGYTGFIPGFNFRYGSSFTKTANESVDEFTERLYREKWKRKKDQFECSNRTTQMTSVRNKDEINNALKDYNDSSCKKQASKISSEFPPIAGYTGHIPRLIGNEMSVSQRYHTAAKAGLALLKEEKDQRNHITIAEESVRSAMTCPHSSELKGYT